MLVLCYRRGNVRLTSVSAVSVRVMALDILITVLNGKFAQLVFNCHLLYNAVV